MYDTEVLDMPDSATYGVTLANFVVMAKKKIAKVKLLPGIIYSEYKSGIVQIKSWYFCSRRNVLKLPVLYI